MIPITSTTIDVADLHRRPGHSRPLSATLDASVVPELPLLMASEPVHVDAILESLVDGILLRGTVATQVTVSCARCLREIPTRLSTDVVELFADTALADPSVEIDAGYEIGELDGHPILDIDTLIRDAVTETVPLRALCRAGCAGLCPTCGADRNTTTCACVEETTDSRWAVLRSLRLSDGEPGRDGPDHPRQ